MTWAVRDVWLAGDPATEGSGSAILGHDDVAVRPDGAIHLGARPPIGLTAVRRGEALSRGPAILPAVKHHVDVVDPLEVTRQLLAQTPMVP